MRIALLTDFFPPDVHNSGIARYVEDLTDALIKRGLEVTVFAAQSTSNTIERRGLLTIYRVPGSRQSKKKRLFPSLNFLLTSYRIWRILKKNHAKKPFDIIEYPNTNSNGLVSLIFGLPAPRPHFVIRMASPRTISPKIGLFPVFNDILEQWQAKLSTAYLSHSHENFKICENAYRISKHKPRMVIHLGLPSKTIPLLKPSNPSVSFNVLFLGRMERRKGFDILALAWPRIAAAIPEAYCIVAGEDFPCEHGESFFQWAVKDMPLFARDRLEYHGMISSEHRDSLYREASVCVMPSRYESFGLVLIETMQYGLPIVSTKIGGIPEVIEHGKTGLLVPPDDPESLSDTVIQLLKNPLLYQEIRNSLANEFQKRFTIERVAEETEAFYLSLINSK